MSCCPSASGRGARDVPAKLEGVFAFGLGGVHGVVGAGDEGVHVFIVFGVEGDADAAADLAAAAVEEEFFAQETEDSVGGGGGVFPGVDAAEDEDEFIAADARHVIRYMSEDLELGNQARKRLFELFPYGYVRQACKIAGMRRPRAWSSG